MRRTKFSKGFFEPKNPEKYIGTRPVIYRSSWELVFMNMCDNHPSIQKWASESIKIPYVNPFTGKATIYVPDFVISYVDKTGKGHTELVEIKPMNQTLSEKARGPKNKIALAINKAKWSSANKWAKKNGMSFRVLTEADMFFQASGLKGKK